MTSHAQYEHWLGGVYVNLPERGKGLASKLVEKSLKEAARLSITDVYLQTEDLTGGIYGRIGFTPVEITCYKGIDVLIMHYKLSC